jgi:mono/diheme cytochrome c family protein
MMRRWVTVLAAGVWIGAATFAVLEAVQGPSASRPDSLKASLMAEGAEIYAVECTTCHAPDGGSDQGPALAGNTSIGSTEFVATRLLNGVKDMPAFAPTLSDRQIAAVATFIRNSWENDHGVVLEAEVKTLRPMVMAK